jgi:hypothetical protein
MLLTKSISWSKRRNLTPSRREIDFFFIGKDTGLTVNGSDIFVLINNVSSFPLYTMYYFFFLLSVRHQRRQDLQKQNHTNNSAFIASYLRIFDSKLVHRGPRSFCSQVKSFNFSIASLPNPLDPPRGAQTERCGGRPLAQVTCDCGIAPLLFYIRSLPPVDIHSHVSQPNSHNVVPPTSLHP